MNSLERIRELVRDIPEGETVTATRVSEIIGVEVSTVTRWLDRGILAYDYRLPGRGRFQITGPQIIAFVESHSDAAAS